MQRLGLKCMHKIGNIESLLVHWCIFIVQHRWGYGDMTMYDIYDRRELTSCKENIEDHSCSASPFQSFSVAYSP